MTAPPPLPPPPPSRAIIVVVDSANVQAELRNVAELLFDLLSSRSVNKQLSSILVACNKQGSATMGRSGVQRDVVPVNRPGTG